MKVIKRDGRAVEYNADKIKIAIEKANKEVKLEKRATPEEIKTIIKYIEEIDKKRILVEDIQDIIEQKLMELGRLELAKKYIVYRYTRALVRKQNTTDESILSLIKNARQEDYDSQSEKAIIASMQRNLIAGEVSKDLTKRMLLPEKITRAHEEGILYFHDAEYFLQPIFNTCFVNLEDMLTHGTCINGKKIDSPKGFQVACTVMTQIIAAVASAQYGEQVIEIKHLGKYLRKTTEKIEKELEEFKEAIPKEVWKEILEKRLKTELKNGIQTIEYQINTLLTTNGRLPQVTLILDLNEKDPYLVENAMIIQEILKQQEKGIPNEQGEETAVSVPKLIYTLREHNALKGGNYDYLTRLAIRCSRKIINLSYISAEKMEKIAQESSRLEGRFNQGIVTINLPQIAILAKTEEDFWRLLKERLDLCQEALMCRHYALMGTKAKISPIHWQQGAIARLDPEETIDQLLKNGNSTLSLGYIGLEETTERIKGKELYTKEGHDFAIKLLKYMKKTIEEWKNNTGITFILQGTSDFQIETYLKKIDQENLGEIKGITNQENYTSSFHISKDKKIEQIEKLKIETEFQQITRGKSNCYLKEEEKVDLEEWEKIIKLIYETSSYGEIKRNT